MLGDAAGEELGPVLDPETDAPQRMCLTLR